MKKKKQLPPLYGDMRDRNFTPFENMKIAGVEVGRGIVVKNNVPERHSFIEALHSSDDKGLLSDEAAYLLHRLRRWLPDVDDVDPKDDLSHIRAVIDGLNSTTQEFQKLENVKDNPVGHSRSPWEITKDRDGKPLGLVLRRNAIPDDPDFVKMSFREWINVISLLVEHGWRMGVNETLRKNRDSTEMLQYLFDNKVIPLSRLLELVADNYEVSPEEAGVILINDLNGVNPEAVRKLMPRLNNKKRTNTPRNCAPKAPE